MDYVSWNITVMADSHSAATALALRSCLPEMQQDTIFNSFALSEFCFLLLLANACALL